MCLYFKGNETHNLEDLFRSKSWSLSDFREMCLHCKGLENPECFPTLPPSSKGFSPFGRERRGKCPSPLEKERKLILWNVQPRVWEVFQTALHSVALGLV